MTYPPPTPTPTGISDKRVTILVALIGLVGVLIPILYNAATVRSPEHPVAIQITPPPPDSGHYVPNKPAESSITVTNRGPSI